jgi:hypothetical protein
MVLQIYTHLEIDEKVPHNGIVLLKERQLFQRAHFGIDMARKLRLKKKLSLRQYISMI